MVEGVKNVQKKNNNNYLFSGYQYRGDERTDAVDRVTQQAAAVPDGYPIMQTTGGVVQLRQVLSDWK